MKFFEGISVFLIVLLFVTFVITSVFVRINYENVTNKIKRKVEYKSKTLISN
jgi:hypothetical protein